MKTELGLTNADEAYIIKNMYPLYLHDLSGHYGLTAGHIPNRHGIFEDDPECRTLAEQYEAQNIWWDKPGVLYPFLIRADEHPAGFVLIATPPHCAQGIQYFVNDFFVLQPFRGTGTAEQAAIQVFDRFRGEWELFTNPADKNITAQAFWRKTLTRYTRGRFAERTGETFDGHKLAFRFNNMEEQAGQC
ncbi:GNAT family N-acetyltransferase [Paenibacillus sp. MMS20-IR301]|uniref:GNAT family N-acetyltransferase n=1 Tax=Paenibacillus sp. MMS20-IR301 TaxID=2895946 RepID=UPI0028F15845|nr:GNAT family N-acetyltransferase [Paenibacillus sp. MMS20-IR301]WNS45621.1 GNAT family N-acetyltransferase [Paenibacillus sp. MMS20-IR301]